MVPHQSVFKDESKLDINYVPQKLPHREKEHRLLIEFFSFILHYPEKMAQRIIVTGEVGTGKTALTQNFGTTLTSEANKRRIKFRYVHINCREHRGSLAPILHKALTVFEPSFPARGYSADELLDFLIKALDKENTHIILALDEFDSLVEKEESDAVYKLTRLQEMRQGLPQRLSFIFIMRDLKAIERLDESAKSTLQRSIIHLERYGKNQLIDILNERVSMSFELGTVSDDVIDLVAGLAFTQTGNARFGIELLWRAGKYADSEDLELVAPECVRRAVSAIIPSLRRSELASLGMHEKLFLLAIARFFRESDEAYVTLSEVEKTYAVICEEFEVQPNSHTQIWTYTQYLSSLGVLKTEVLTVGSRGRQTRISLPSIPAGELEKEMMATLHLERV